MQAYGPHMEIEVVLHYHTSFCDDRLDIIMCNMMLNLAPQLKSKLEAAVRTNRKKIRKKEIQKYFNHILLFEVILTYYLNFQAIIKLVCLSFGRQ